MLVSEMMLEHCVKQKLNIYCSCPYEDGTCVNHLKKKNIYLFIYLFIKPPPLINHQTHSINQSYQSNHFNHTMMNKPLNQSTFCSIINQTAINYLINPWQGLS